MAAVLRGEIEEVLRRPENRQPCRTYWIDPRNLRDRSQDDDTAPQIVALPSWSDRTEEQGSHD